MIAKLDKSLRLLDLVALDEEQSRPHEIVRRFWEGWRRYDRPRLVSFNGRGFDMPLLELCAFRYGIQIPDWSAEDARSFDQPDGPAGNAFAEASAGEEPTVTHWGTQHLRHASLRVGGEAGEQAIDIQLSMKGQEVQVEFKTDSAEARASLREHAGESLADLLNKSGIQLGGVSVGAQGQPGSRGDGAPTTQNGMRGVASGPQATAAVPSRAVQAAPRADGSQPLDVFA